MGSDEYERFVAQANEAHRKTLSQDNYVLIDRGFAEAVEEYTGREVTFELLAGLLGLDREDDGAGHQAAAVGHGDQGDPR